MAAAAPRLTSDDLKAELARFHAGEHRTFDTAFYGTGNAEHIQVPVRGENKLFRVVPVDCELRLREQLAGRAEDEPIVLLVDYTERLPIDVEGRLAHGGLIYVSPERRLSNLFGGKAVAPALLEGPLAEALLRDGRRFELRSEGSTVDVHGAWRAYLERAAGLPSLGDLREELVVEHFAATRERPPAAFGDPELRTAARAYLAKTAGPIAALAFEAWLAGRGIDVAALSFVIEPLSGTLADGYVLAFLEGQLDELEKGLTPEPALIARWRSMAQALGLRLGVEDRRELLDRVLANADARVRDKPKLEPLLAESRYLASGLRAAKAELARALDRIAVATGVDGRGALAVPEVEAAIAAQRRVRDHRLAESPTEQPLIERLEMAVRLVVYLLGNAQREAKLDALNALVETARELADHYAAEGGFVDYARRCVRAGATTDALDEAVARVLAVVDAIRDAQDTRFAPALKRWNDERKPGHLVPIEQVLETLGLALVQQCPGAKLLILVMDGMAWHAAVEILLDLREAHYGPLRFQPKGASKLPVPMIAALPTMTEVSRAALFAGKLLRVGEKTSTLKDPDRLREHRGFVKALGQGPRLLLRTEAEDNAGHLTTEARKLLHENDPVVGLVVNTVDDMLGAKPSYRAHYTRQTIKALAPLLEEARAAQRAVLMVADHGHVQSDRKREIVKVEGADSPRYRELRAKAPSEARELVLSDANTYRQRAEDSVALLYREADRYRDVHNLGEHGGASLSEVVTPAFLIGADDLHQMVALDEDSAEALQTIAWPVPGWWNLELPAAKARVAPAPRPAREVEPAKKPKVDSQIGMFDEPRRPASKPAPLAQPSPAEPSPWTSRVQKLYEKEPEGRRADLAKVLPLLDLLVAHAGRISDEVLAGKLGQPQRNIGGLVAVLGEFLNVDGYDVVRYGVASRQVELEVALLPELFGEEP